MRLLLATILSLFLVTAHAADTDLRAVAPSSAKSLVLTDMGGKKFDLASYRGRVVLVNFWATYCPPCLKEMPSMERLQQRMKGKPFAILAVDVGEQNADVQAFMKQVPVTFPVLMDRDARHFKAWKAYALPSSFVVDAQGRVRYVIFGGTEWDEPDALGKLMALLPAR
ncbi:MAG TPA: TlpA disulfide reductase family protein [Sulfuriferula sp.]|nr:TlpA disulfide reductase family protein [Sulfuriferula sp.]